MRFIQIDFFIAIQEIKPKLWLRVFTLSLLLCFAVPPKLAPFAISDEPLHLGDYFQLTCAVLHGDSPYNITWYFNDEPITYVDGVSILFHGKRSSSLNIESVSAKHSGVYLCTGSNAAGRANVTTTLSIRGLCHHYLDLDLQAKTHFSSLFVPLIISLPFCNWIFKFW